MTNSASFYLRVMSLVAEHEAYDSLFWRTDGTYAPITLFIRCNDLFYWAMADLEEITPENVRELALALEDADLDGPLLFCARARKMRPQGPYYKHLDKKNWHLFDACGPERPESPRPT